MNTNRERKKNVPKGDYRHQCALDADNSRFFRGVSFSKALRTCTDVSQSNPNTKYYFRSLTAIDQELKRHREVKQKTWFHVIHPLSLFRISWECMYILIFYAGFIAIPLNFINGPMRPGAHLRFEYGVCAFTEYLEIATDALCFIDVLMNFFTGYCFFDKRQINLNALVIARLHLSSMSFYVDLVCSISVISIAKLYIWLTTAPNLHWLLFVKPLGGIKILRLSRFLTYYDNAMQFVYSHFYLRTTLRIALTVSMLVHWLTCIYLVVQQNTILYAHNGADHYLYRLEEGALLRLNTLRAYANCFCTVLSYLLCITVTSRKGASYAAHLYTITELIVFILLSTLGSVLCCYLLIVLVEMIRSRNIIEYRYHSLKSQLDRFMLHNNLPPNLRQQMTIYSHYRFQGRYYNERIISYMSEPLRNDISLHSCLTLIKSVPLLYDLPPDMLTTVVSHLQHEVYLYNDTIVAAGTSPDCMFFLAQGTVGVYTRTGHEVCHLEDGAYFGELELVCNDHERIANVIAIEMCEVYRLNRCDFFACFDENSPVYKKFEQIAQERKDKTILLEELHKKYLLDRNTTRRRREFDKEQENATLHRLISIF